MHNTVKLVSGSWVHVCLLITIVIEKLPLHDGAQTSDFTSMLWSSSKVTSLRIKGNTLPVMGFVSGTPTLSKPVISTTVITTQNYTQRLWQYIHTCFGYHRWDHSWRPYVPWSSPGTLVCPVLSLWWPQRQLSHWNNLQQSWGRRGSSPCSYHSPPPPCRSNCGRWPSVSH